MPAGWTVCLISSCMHILDLEVQVFSVQNLAQSYFPKGRKNGFRIWGHLIPCGKMKNSSE